MVYICNTKCSMFCLIMSVWGFIQLILMGLFHTIRSLAFLPSLPLRDTYDSLKEFREDSDEAFDQVALRCYASGILYGMFAILSLICIRLKKNQIIAERNRNLRIKSHV